MENIFENCEIELKPGCKMPVRCLDDIIRNINLIQKRYDDVNTEFAIEIITNEFFKEMPEKSKRLWNDFKKEEIDLKYAKEKKLRELNEKRLKKINKMLK